MRVLVALVALTLGCAPASSPQPSPHDAAAVAPASTPAIAQTQDTQDTARCEWPERKGKAPTSAFTVGDAEVDIVRLAAGLPPLTEDQKRQVSEQYRIDDALEGSVGCEVRDVRGQMPASHYAFATDLVLDEVARCFYEPGRPRNGEVMVRLSFDDSGQPRRAHVEQAKLEAPVVSCVEAIFSLLRPARHFGVTDEVQASAGAVVKLELDLPAVR